MGPRIAPHRLASDVCGVPRTRARTYFTLLGSLATVLGNVGMPPRFKFCCCIFRKLGEMYFRQKDRFVVSYPLSTCS